MVSVIIPTLNEAAALERTLTLVVSQANLGRIIVVDAGSADGTLDIASRFSTERIHSPKRRRAFQMNLGARQATGEALLFLHADTLLPRGALERVCGALSKPRVVGGAFARRFDSPSLFLRLTCALAELRSRALGWHLGDQAIFVRRSVFTDLNGFTLLDRFEDLDFSRRMARHGKVVTLRPPVLSSARRFSEIGAVRRTARDFLLTMHYLRGDPAALYHTSPHAEAGTK